MKKAFLLVVAAAILLFMCGSVCHAESEEIDVAIYHEDIVNIELESGNIHRSFMKHSIGTGDSAANRFGIRVLRNGEEVDLTGCSCYGYFQDPHGNNIALTSNGTVDGAVAYVTLPQACYNYEGQFCLSIKLIGGGVTGTMRIVDGVIDNTNTGSAVAPTSTVPTYSEILSQYDAMVAATAAANGMTADTFDATKAYSAGKYVINSGALYRLTADHAANTTWANTSKVEVKFGNELSDTKSAIDKKGEPMLLGLKKFSLPNEFNYTPKVDVYTDGNKFTTNFNAANHKNSGGSVIYVDNKGNTGNAYDGSTPGKATTFGKAKTMMSDGDTIILLEDISRESTAYSAPISKSVNVIGAKDDICIFDGNFVQFAAVSGYNNVYSATRSLARKVIDVTDKKKLLEFVAVSSISEVEITKGSVYISGNTVYIHPYSIKSVTDKKLLVTVDYEKWLDVDNTGATEAKNIYFENITLIGKYDGVHIDKSVDSYDFSICFNNCGFIFCGHEAEENNAVNVSGGDVLFYKCKVLNSGRDGVNYHDSKATGTEIDCIMAGNGKGASANTMNGSTCHTGAKCLRINGKYYDNQGANVADVQNNTQSVNIGCIAFQPSCSDGYSQNFSGQQSGSTMWLYNCIAVGAIYDLYTASGATMFVDRCAYDVKEERGSITETNNRKPVSNLLFSMMRNGM